MASNVGVHGAVASPIETMSSTQRRNRLVLSGLAAAIGAASVAINLGGAMDGTIPAVCRAALGAVGVLAGSR